jgi:hypothetical protein
MKARIVLLTLMMTVATLNATAVAGQPALSQIVFYVA